MTSLDIAKKCQNRVFREEIEKILSNYENGKHFDGF